MASSCTTSVTSRARRSSRRASCCLCSSFLRRHLHECFVAVVAAGALPPVRARCVRVPAARPRLRPIRSLAFTHAHTHARTQETARTRTRAACPPWPPPWPSPPPPQPCSMAIVVATVINHQPTSLQSSPDRHAAPTANHRSYCVRAGARLVFAELPFPFDTDDAGVLAAVDKAVRGFNAEHAATGNRVRFAMLDHITSQPAIKLPTKV